MIPSMRNRFETLYRRHSRSVFALAWRLCGFNAAEAEDVTQETFLRALDAFERYADRDREFGWLKTICSRIVYEKWRRTRFFERAIRPEFETAGGAEPAPDPERRAHIDERMQQLLEALPRVTAEYREALVLKHMGGLSDEDIAGLQRTSAATVRSRIRRARAELAGIMVKEDDR